MNSKIGSLNTLFIINRICERKLREGITDVIGKSLNTNKFNPKIVYSEYPGHAREIANENIDKYQVYIAGGGDGTINQVASSMIGTEIPLGILPLGSGKGLARSLGIPLNIKEAIETINNFYIQKIDTGLINQNRFINIAGIGFDALVADSYNDIHRRGFFAYVTKAFEVFLRYSPQSVQVRTENQETSGSYFLVSVANSSQWGYGTYISPQSKTDDGLLDVCMFKKFPRIIIPILATRLFTKSIHRSRYVEIIPVQKAEITGKDVFKGHIDGEPVEFKSPVRISIEPGSLNVICPSNR
jgi:diacylglycerol kinase (ATP)